MRMIGLSNSASGCEPPPVRIKIKDHPNEAVVTPVRSTRVRRMRGDEGGTPRQRGWGDRRWGSDPPIPTAGRLGGDHKMALHGGDPGRRGRRRPGRGGLVDRVHVTVQLRGMVGHPHADVARVDLSLALEGVLDHFLDLLRARRRLDRDGVCHADHSADLANHPLDFAPLVVVTDLAVERDPAVLHPACTLPSRTCTFHSRTCAIALAMSESSRGASASLTCRSLATALTPSTRSGARAAASLSAYGGT